MTLEYLRVTPETVELFLDFFDNAAFPEGDIWANCYCLEGSLAGEKSIFDPAVRREHAKQLVFDGRMSGYLIRDGGRLIGWVKAVDKCDLVDPDDAYGLFSGTQVYGEVKSLYCIDLVGEYQGRGIAKKILQKVIDDAKTEGYKYLEVYPAADRYEHRNYRGHAGMYEQFGFETIRETDEHLVMQKKL